MKEGSLFFWLHNIAAGERVNVDGRGQTLINILSLQDKRNIFWVFCQKSSKLTYIFVIKAKNDYVLGIINMP